MLSKYRSHYGPLTRYVKLRVVYAPGMPETFTPPQISKETAIVSMPGSLTSGVRENFPGIPGACATGNVTYLAKGPSVRQVVASVWHGTHTVPPFVCPYNRKDSQGEMFMKHTKMSLFVCFVLSNICPMQVLTADDKYITHDTLLTIHLLRCQMWWHAILASII